MKRLVLLLICVMCISSVCEAQRGYSRKRRAKSKASKTRHIEGMKALDLVGGISEIGYFGKLGGAIWIQNNHGIRGNAFYDHGKVFTNQIRRYGVDVAYLYSPYSLEGQLFFNVLAGGSVVYDHGSKSEELQVSNKVNTGILLGAEVEWYMSDAVSLLVAYDFKYMFINSYGNIRSYPGIGLRYNFRY